MVVWLIQKHPPPVPLNGLRHLKGTISLACQDSLFHLLRCRVVEMISMNKMKKEMEKKRKNLKMCLNLMLVLVPCVDCW
jgi:hypothetical protein